MLRLRLGLVFLMVLFAFAACASSPEVEPVVVTIDEPESGPEIVEPEPESEPEVVEPGPEIVELEPEPDEPLPAGPIEVPEDLYNQAFAEVEAIIAELNQIISRREFAEWKTYLTPEYIEYHSDPDVLTELSRQPILAQNNIRLSTLRDYFENVVVPSRARARLDDLVFYSDTLVEAVTDFRGQRVLLYLLRKVDGEWKIDTQDVLPEESSGE